MFQVIENADPMKYKQLAKGIDQLMDEGVAQLFTMKTNGRKVIGTVGQLQFEVIQYRLEHEYGAKCRYEPINVHKAVWVQGDDEKQLEDFTKMKYRSLAEDKHGRLVFMADTGFALQMAQEKYPNLQFLEKAEY
jgi:peptide chain release factor 3